LDGVELKTVHGHPCLSISCSPDGKQLAVGDTKGFVTLFDTTSKAQTNYRTFHDNKVLTLQFTEDSQRLFTLGFDCEATLSSVEDPKQVLKISSKYIIIIMFNDIHV
jgi:WD40 repeat protein